MIRMGWAIQYRTMAAGLRSFSCTGILVRMPQWTRLSQNLQIDPLVDCGGPKDQCFQNIIGPPRSGEAWYAGLQAGIFLIKIPQINNIGILAMIRFGGNNDQ